MRLGLGMSLVNLQGGFSPATIASLTAMFVRPNYAKVSTTGTWTASVGSNATNGGLNAPAATNGAPVFAGTSSVEGIRCGQNEGALFTMTGTPEGSCFVVANITSLDADGATPPVNPSFFAESSRGAFGFGVSASGAIAFASDGSYQSARSAFATGSVRSACMRFKSGVDVGVKVDGGAWVQSALGVYSPTTTNLIQIGNSYDGLHEITGTVLAILFFSTRIADADATNLRTWAQTKFGAA